MSEPLQNLLYSYAFNIINGQAGGEYVYSLQENCIYIYEDNVWKKLFDKEFLDRIERNITAITHFTLNQRKEIIENFKHKKYLRLEGFNKTDLINFENCMFDPLTLEATEHKKEYYSTIRIPYKYDPEMKCPLWEKATMEIFENNQEKISALQEFCGYCISSTNEHKKAVLLLGDKNTGKSTLIDIIKEIIGDVNCSNVPLQYLSNPQYTPLLINKMLNVDPEVNREAVSYEREFKLLTGGKREKIACNQKHIPTFEFIPRCKLLLSANEFPKITDHSSAFYERLLLIPCERRFLSEEQDKTLDEKLRKELPGIFNWCIEGLKRLRERGHFLQYDFMKEAIEELENENNPSNSFFEEHIEIVSGQWIVKGDLYDKYKSWCDKTKTFPLRESRFSIAVFKKYSKHTTKNNRFSNSGKRYWPNLQYVEYKRQMEYTQEEE